MTKYDRHLVNDLPPGWMVILMVLTIGLALIGVYSLIIHLVNIFGAALVPR